MIPVEQAVKTLNDLISNPDTNAKAIENAVAQLHVAARQQHEFLRERAQAANLYRAAMDAAADIGNQHALLEVGEALGGTARLREWIAAGEVSMSLLVGWLQKANFGNAGNLAHDIASGKV